MSAQNIKPGDRVTIAAVVEAEGHDDQHVIVRVGGTPVQVAIPSGTEIRPTAQSDGPNPLDDRLLAMARILRESGLDEADEIETAAAYVREAWRGSDDGGIAEALETIAAYVAELVRIVRDWPAEADEADRLASEEA